SSALRWGYQVFFSEGLDTFVADLQRARPTLFHSVPRLWVKFQQAVQAKLPAEKLQQLLSQPETAEETRRQVLTTLGLQDCRFAITGSAPLAPSVQAWYRDLGLELLEGYGMTEDLAYSHLARPGRARIGYVGDANDGVARRIAENGEVQIQSPAQMLGYYKDPEKTAEAFTEDGWFRTGDLGEVDEEGRLKLTGRLKELFKTSKGKYVAPAPIENRLGDPLIEVACVSGANQTQPFVLILPSALAQKMLEDGRGAELKTQVELLLDRVNAASDPHEELAFAVLVRGPWSIENGMLTPTMKIKRNLIEKAYADKVDSWYAARQRVIVE
ncbi:MAG: AMP-binding protein, partial [Oceanococcaceae bacterium]